MIPAGPLQVKSTLGPQPPRSWLREAHGLASRRLHDAALITLPVAILLVRPFIVLFLAFGEPDLKLGTAPLPVEFERNDGVAAPFHGPDHVIELAPIEQKLACAGGVGIH